MTRLTFVILIAILFAGCEEPKKVNESTTQDQFDWLLGSWKRSNEAEGRETYEYWNKINATTYHGTGHTIENTDTVWQESILLSKEDNQWNFSVAGDDTKAPTIFVLTKSIDKGFTCYNAENDFPKQIEYKLVHGKIEAVISGSGMTIPFEFTRIK